MKKPSLVSISAVIVFLVVIGFVGWMVYEKNTSGSSQSASVINNAAGSASIQVNTGITPNLNKWVCKGFQGCWCENGSGGMAQPASRQENEAACTAAIVNRSTGVYTQ